MAGTTKRLGLSKRSMSKRICGACGKVKPFTDYPKKWDGPDGRSFMCKECTKKSNRIFKGKWRGKEHESAQRD